MRFAFFSSGFFALACTVGVVCIGGLILGRIHGARWAVKFFPIPERRKGTRKAAVKNTVSTILLAAGFILTAAALFEPEWGEKQIEQPYSGQDIMFCVDISNSMAARDVELGRLGLAKLFIRNVLAEAGGSSFGVSIFKGDGTVAVPLTQDTTFIDRFIENINPGYSTVPGTNVEKGLLAAASGFSEERPGKGYIFLISDGEGLEGNPGGLEKDIFQGIEVWTFLTGTAGGGSIRNKADKNIRTAADPELLRLLAEQYSGRFFNLSDPDWLADFTRAFSNEQNRTGTGALKYTYEPIDRYPLFIIAAILCCCSYVLFRTFLWKEEL